MNAGDFLKIVTHLGSLVKAGKDVEQLIADLIAKKSVGADVSSILDDLSAILTLFPIPGVPAEIVTQTINGIKTVV